MMNPVFNRPRFAGRLAALLLLLPLLFLSGLRGAAAEEAFLPPEQAFRVSTHMADGRTVEVRYDIAPGYYMYRERFAFKANGAALGEPVFPSGDVHYDETFQKDVETYRDKVAIRIPVRADGRFTLDVTAQGCSEQGLCYPPMSSSIELAAAAGASPAAAAPRAAAAPPQQTGAQPALGRIATALHSRELLAIVPMFLLLGLGLAFTPCVLPMMPILSSIIVGDGAGASRGRGFALSASYSAGMAIVYTLLGVAAGLAGEGLAASLQNPWVLGAFALLMVALALAMLGAYPLQMPAAIQQRLLGSSSRQEAGTHAGVFAMGALAALIVGPCVAAPLAGALLYISQTGDAFIGGSALFAMAAGMSVPLLLLGASAGALLPRAGAWMEEVKRLFGVLMLASAWWIVAPLLAGPVQLAGWGVLGLGYGAWLLLRGPRRAVPLIGGFLIAAVGALELAGAAAGGADPLAPLKRDDSAASTHFRRVKTVAQLDAVLAAGQGKVFMLDFYADWCVSCKEMEKFTFSDPRVRARLDRMVLLQADVTANDADDRALLKRFGLFGPPGIIFFANGRELQGARVIGYQDADEFLGSLAATAP